MAILWDSFVFMGQHPSLDACKSLKMARPERLFRAIHGAHLSGALRASNFVPDKIVFLVRFIMPVGYFIAQ